MTDTSDSPSDQSYRIGEVARLTGISTHTLRVWERRYGAVSTTRTESGRRVYLHNDLRRLALIRSLLDKGSPISTVANLSLEQLERKLEAVRPLLPRESPDAPRLDQRIALVGPTITALLRLDAKLTRDFHPVFSATQLAGSEDALTRANPETIVLEYSSLQTETVEHIHEVLEATKARQLILIYGYASSRTLARLSDPRITTLQAPVEPYSVWLACRSAGRKAPRSAPGAIASSDSAFERPATGSPAPRYTHAQLLRLSQISSNVDCECPRHVSGLVRSLMDFEAFSSECAVATPADAQLHRQLALLTAQARLVMENALDQLLTADNISLD